MTLVSTFAYLVNVPLAYNGKVNKLVVRWRGEAADPSITWELGRLLEVLFRWDRT